MHRCYKFNQFYYQDDSGWCVGLSYALLTHLYENKDDCYSYLMPETAFIESREYLALFKKTFDPIQRTLSGIGYEFRKSIHQLQIKYQSRVFREKSIFPSDLGAGILRLYLTENQTPEQYKAGQYFNRSSFSIVPVPINHSGVVVWSPMKIFLFDPNCGVAIYERKKHVNIVCAIDECLKDMYITCDRLSFTRVAQVINIINPQDLAFGKV